jgi:hypothetical protein
MSFLENLPSDLANSEEYGECCGELVSKGTFEQLWESWLFFIFVIGRQIKLNGISLSFVLADTR